MQVAIIGYDTEGRVSYDYFVAQGHDVTICDMNDSIETPPGASAVLGESYLDDLDRFDLLVRTAGMPAGRILDKNPGVVDKITSHVNEFFKASPTRNIIGVTGTKGKGTTSTMLTRMLEADGQHVFLGGNIGIPPLSFINKLTKDSWVVLELSSFQLSDLHYSPHIGVCLMVVPEHLNWHEDMDDYIEAKSNMFAHQTARDTAIYFADSAISERIAANGNGRKIPFFTGPGAVVQDGYINISGEIICEINEVRLLGKHNLQNICAAVTAAWQVTQNTSAIYQVVTTFTGLPHRLEHVKDVDGVHFYDDSFGTTPETAIVALRSFKEPKVVILGGSDKGASYDTLASEVTLSNVKHVILIGEQGPSIETALKRVGFDHYSYGGSTMKSIVSAAQSNATSGDVVLLSTACASFDMFKNYKDRAAQFISAVESLGSTLQ